MMGKKGRKGKSYKVWLALLVLFLAWRQFGPGLPVEVVSSHSEIADAFAKERTGMMIQIDTRVLRLLPEAEKGATHQRFIIELDNLHQLLVSHNLDHAPRVPLAEFDLVRIRGEYQWNAQGGAVHWTHRDPGFGLKHGWIEHKGKRYD